MRKFSRRLHRVNLKHQCRPISHNLGIRLNQMLRDVGGPSVYSDIVNKYHINVHFGKDLQEQIFKLHKLGASLDQQKEN